MRIQVSARRCRVPDPVRDRSRSGVEALARYESRLSSARVVFQEEGHRKSVEILLTVDGAEPVVASGQGRDFKRALDRTLDRLGRILRRRHAQRLDHQAMPLSEVPRPGE